MPVPASVPSSSLEDVNASPPEATTLHGLHGRATSWNRKPRALQTTSKHVPLPLSLYTVNSPWELFEVTITPSSGNAASPEPCSIVTHSCPSPSTSSTSDLEGSGRMFYCVGVPFIHAKAAINFGRLILKSMTGSGAFGCLVTPAPKCRDAEGEEMPLRLYRF